MTNTRGTPEIVSVTVGANRIDLSGRSCCPAGNDSTPLTEDAQPWGEIAANRIKCFWGGELVINSH
jgi:hypothetical protein